VLLWAGSIAAAGGRSTDKSKIEGLRSKLKRLAERLADRERARAVHAALPPGAGCVAPAPGDFEAYWAFHTRREHDRVHQARGQDGYDLIA
jgi:hypothetical protein